MMANDQKKSLVFCMVAFIALMTGACSLKLQKFDIETPAQILSTVDSPPVSETDRLLLIGYSKGITDILHFIDPRNDSQLIFYDQIIPGSTLLGFANTDHWDIAMPVRQMYRFWADRLNCRRSLNFPKTSFWRHWFYLQSNSFNRLTDDCRGGLSV